MVSKFLRVSLVIAILCAIAYAMHIAYEHRSLIEQFLFAEATVEGSYAAPSSDPTATLALGDLVSMRPFTVEKDTYCSPYPEAQIDDSVYVLREGVTAYLTGRVETHGTLSWVEIYAERHRPTCWIPSVPVSSEP